MSDRMGEENHQGESHATPSDRSPYRARVARVRPTVRATRRRRPNRETRRLLKMTNNEAPNASIFLGIMNRKNNLADALEPNLVSCFWWMRMICCTDGATEKCYC